MDESKQSFRVWVTISNDEAGKDVSFRAWYDVKNNTLGDPFETLGAGSEVCCHGSADILKEAAFHAGLLEDGK